MSDQVVKNGRWYHEFSVPCRCFIVSRGSQNTALFFVQFEQLGEPGRIGKEEGPFHKIEDAMSHARISTNGTLRWET